MIRLFIDKLAQLIGSFTEGSIHFELLILAFHHEIGFLSLVKIRIKSINNLILSADVGFGKNFLILAFHLGELLILLFDFDVFLVYQESQVLALVLQLSQC